MDRKSAGSPRPRLRAALMRSAGCIGLVAAAFIATACSSGSGGGGASSAAGSSSSSTADAGGYPSKGIPKQGGSVTMTLDGVVSTIDPAVNQIYTFSDGGPMTAIFGALDYEDSHTGNVQYLLLKTMTSNADYTQWTMVVNPNIKFSDGTPFNAQAILFNYQRFANPATASPLAAIVNTFASMKVVDDLDFEITLKTPNAGFPNEIAENLAAIGSPAAIQSEGAKFAQQPVGAGPFVLKSFIPNQQVVVTRNPLWAQFKPNQPYLDQLTFINLPDYSQQETALQTNQAQLADPTGAGAISTLQKAGQNSIVTNTNGGGNIIMNTAIAPFNDPKAREAITLSLDRTAAANAFAEGTPPVQNLFQKSSPYYDAKNDLPQTVDATKAQQLYDQLAAAGKTLDFTFETISSPQQAPFAAYLQAALAKFKNVKVTIKSVPAAQYSQDFRNGRYEMTPHGLYMIAPVPGGAPDYFGPSGTKNTEKWTNATADAAVANILATNQSDTATLKKDWDTVQQQLALDNPIYWCDIGELGFIYNKDLVAVNGMQTINYGVYPIWGELGYKQG